MKNTLAIQIKTDIKTVRRAVALITGEAMTDEEIENSFFDREPLQLDLKEALGETEEFQICAAFTAILLADDIAEHPESKFHQKLKERMSK